MYRESEKVIRNIVLIKVLLDRKSSILTFVLLSCLSTSTFGQSEVDKRMYMMGYCYGGLFLTERVLDQYHDKPFATLKLVFNMSMFAEELLAELSSKDLSTNFTHVEMSIMKEYLRHLSQILPMRISNDEAKHRFQKFDKYFSQLHNHGGRFSFLVTLGGYTTSLTYFGRPIISKEVLMIWEQQLLRGAKEYEMPLQLREALQDLVTAIKKSPLANNLPESMAGLTGIRMPSLKYERRGS